jgi:DNA replication protein DnaC
MDRNRIVQKLNNEYSAKRRLAQFLATTNKETAYADKKYFELEIKERSLILDLAKLRLENKSTKAVDIEIKTITTKKLIILKELGLKQTDLEANYACKLCDDSGMIDGKRCICYKQELNKRQMAASQINLNGLPTLDSYDTSIFKKEDQEQVNKVLELCKKFTNNFKTTKINTLIFSGEIGIGKTYLSKVIAKDIIKKGYAAYFTTAFSLNNLLLKYHTTFDNTKVGMLDTLLNCDLLIIDDLGTEPVYKNVTLEYLLLIINERIGLNKSIIINTNLNPGNLIDKYGERIFSRLMNKQNSLLINMGGKDLRLKKANTKELLWKVNN